MAIAFDDLHLSRLYVVYPGRERYTLRKNIEVLPLEGLLDAIEALTKHRTIARTH